MAWIWGVFSIDSFRNSYLGDPVYSKAKYILNVAQTQCQAECHIYHKQAKVNMESITLIPH